MPKKSGEICPKAEAVNKTTTRLVFVAVFFAQSDRKQMLRTPRDIRLLRRHWGLMFVVLESL
jgi:hypothetical protein